MLTILIGVLAVLLVLTNLAKDLLKEGPLSKHETKHKRVLIALVTCAAIVAITLAIATVIQKNREKKAAEEGSRNQQLQEQNVRKEEEDRREEQKEEQIRAQQKEAEQQLKKRKSADLLNDNDPHAQQGEHHPLIALGRFFRGEGQYIIGNHPPGFYSVQSAPPISKQHPHQADMAEWMLAISPEMSTVQLMTLGPKILDNCKQARFENLGLPFKWFFAMKGAYAREYGSNAWQSLQEGVPLTAQYWTEPDPGDDTNARIKQYGCRQVQLEMTNLQRRQQ